MRQRKLRPDHFQPSEAEKQRRTEAMLEMPPVGLPSQLDWEAYYEDFKEKHGEPVLHKDTLIFPDGWTYSARSKAGPEFPPPPWPQLHQVLVTYWIARLNLVGTEYRYLQDSIRSLRELQRCHSLPLRASTLVTDEGGKQTKETMEVRIQELENGRLAWLADDIRNCREQLASLERLYQQYRPQSGKPFPIRSTAV